MKSLEKLFSNFWSDQIKIQHEKVKGGPDLHKLPGLTIKVYYFGDFNKGMHSLSTPIVHSIYKFINKPDLWCDCWGFTLLITLYTVVCFYLKI